MKQNMSNSNRRAFSHSEELLDGWSSSPPGQRKNQRHRFGKSQSHRHKPEARGATSRLLSRPVHPDQVMESSHHSWSKDQTSTISAQSHTSGSSSQNTLINKISGPRLPGQGCKALTQEIVSAICLNDEAIVLRITMLAAGFVIGPKGSSIKAIAEKCGVAIKSKTVQGGAFREFTCSGNEENVVQAVEIIKEAVNTYKILTEGEYKGKCVQSTMVVHGITFDYCPPPKSKMPDAASVMKLSPKLLARREEPIPSMSTLHSSSSVDSNLSSEQCGCCSRHQGMKKSNDSRRQGLESPSYQDFESESRDDARLSTPIKHTDSPFAEQSFSFPSPLSLGGVQDGFLQGEIYDSPKVTHMEELVVSPGPRSAQNIWGLQSHDNPHVRSLINEYYQMDL